MSEVDFFQYKCDRVINIRDGHDVECAVKFVGPSGSSRKDCYAAMRKAGWMVGGLEHFCPQHIPRGGAS